MDRLSAVFPELLVSFVAELEAAGNTYLANQLRDSRISSAHYNPDDNVATILLCPPRELNVVERRVIGERYETSIPVSREYMAHVDVDNFDRPTGIEILALPQGLVAKLTAMMTSNNRGSGHDA
jgi:hypothetical protein